MPPKPQVFKTPDGKEFNTKKEWREYMILNFYSFTRKVNEPEPLVKAPGSIDGQTFDIAECENSTLVVLDHTEQIQIDQTKNCKIFIGACASSIFIRNCNDCTFYTCCRQLRLREVVNCTFHIYSMAEVHIEYSSKLKFAPFNGGYPEHAEHLGKANLKVDHNLWYDVYDHNDPNKTRENWSLLPVEHYGEPWFPAGAVCEPAVPITAIGSVKRADADGNMQSFSVQDMMQTTRTASKTSDSPVAPPPPQNTPVVSQPIMDAETAHITETVSKFATSKAGDDFSTFLSHEFAMILPNGKMLSAADVAASADIQGGALCTTVDKVCVSFAKDMASAVFCMSEGDAVVRYTTVLKKDPVSNGWRIFLVQKSFPFPISETF